MNTRLVSVIACLLTILTGRYGAVGSSSTPESPAGRSVDDVALNVGWAERVFTGSPTGANHRLRIVHEDVAGDTKVGTCAAVERPPLRLGDKTYTRGIGVNSRSIIRVTLAKSAAKFQAEIGLDRNVDRTAASVTMHVQAGGKDLFATPVIRPDGTVRAVDVALNGANEFDLIVNDGGDGRGWDQADWCNPQVVLQDGSRVWLDDIARQTQVDAGLPFSLVYDGQPSSKFLSTWRRTLDTATVNGATRTMVLTLSDPKTLLEIRVACRVYTDTGAVDYTLHLTNRGQQDTPIIEQLKAVDVGVLLGWGPSPVLHRLRGSTCAADDWLPFDESLPPGKRIEFGAVNGRSSADSPFFNVNWGSGGLIAAVGWSGQWRGSAEQGQDRRLRIQAGMERLRLKLRPGESIRSPRIMLLQWSGEDAWRGYNAFRRTMLNHIVPRIAGQPVTPPIAHLSTSFYELNNTTEANVLSHLESVKGLGFELLWLDAYWTRDGFPAGMGHYGFPIERVEPRDRFPRGLKPIGQAVHQEGLRYLMWFEPERVHPGTALTKEHPEWVISPSKDGGGLFNLGIPAAREYMTRYLNTVIKEYGIDCLRIDYNIDPLPFWDHLNKQDANRVGIGEIRYVEGLYRMWDDILKANPHLFIDNCASGGRRIDLETCSRSIPLWRSDNTCDMLDGKLETVDSAAVKNQIMSAGLNRYVPFSVVGQMGTTPYLFRSGFNAGIAFAQDCRPAGFPREQLRQAIAEGKRIRKYWFGDFFVLSDVTLNPKEWVVLQYHRPTENDGIILAFRRPASPYSAFDCEPRGIEPDAQYELTQAQSYEPSKATRVSGEKLRRLRAEIADRPGSLLIEYRKVAP